MKQAEWIQRAAARLLPYKGNHSQEYATGLYQTYVQGDGGGWSAEWADDPEGAVDEDMSYWNG